MDQDSADRNELDACPLCGGTRGFEWARLWQDSFLCRLERCDRCRFTYLNPQPSKQLLAAFQERDLYYAEHAPSADGLEKILIGLERFEPPGRLLEIGCNRGDLLAAAAARGWEAFGVELSSEGARVAGDRLGDNVFHGELADSPFRDQPHDLVILWHVLEHLPQPRVYLEQLLPTLRSGGLLAVQVPGLGAYEELQARSQLHQLVCPVHLSYFEVDTLVRLITEAGLSVVAASEDAPDHFISAFARRRQSWSPGNRLELVEEAANGGDKMAATSPGARRGGETRAEPEWENLDPIFILGMHRSGTTAIGATLDALGSRGFAEGRLWLELVRPFANLLDPSFLPAHRHASYTLGENRASALMRHFALALDRFHRDYLHLDRERWFDRSPGRDPVLLAPLLGQLFPKSRFLFLYRNCIQSAHSAVHKWPRDVWAFRKHCREWAQTMSAWRQVRSTLIGRHLEIAQESMAEDPWGTAAQLCRFLNHPTATPKVAELLSTIRPESAFPGLEAGDYEYEINWTPAQKRFLARTCGAEMRSWGFSLDLLTVDG